MRLILPLLLLASLTACKPEPPEPPAVPEQQHPEPQATELRDAIQAPQDKARAVQDTLDAAAAQQREDIEAAESGGSTEPNP